MAIEMVRIPSETPNISNTDDFVGLRYAYGNQSGYAINKGDECSYTINGSKFKINSGRLVIQGVECDIDANGVEITIDNVATKKYYTVYLQVNLATNETKILAMSDLTSYPTIQSGNDLTQNTIGTATMELYHFEATSGVISNVKKIVSKIEYTGTALVGYDISKGTVEERLTNLGFKQGVMTTPSSLFTPITNYVKRQGNYVIGKLEYEDYQSQPTDMIIAKIPENFRPKQTEIIGVNFQSSVISDGTEPAEINGWALIKVNGDVQSQIFDNGGDSHLLITNKYKGISFGYEANPLT